MGWRYTVSTMIKVYIDFIIKILNLYIILLCTHLYQTSFRYLFITCNAFIAIKSDIRNIVPKNDPHPRCHAQLAVLLTPVHILSPADKLS